jgi:hypothetical protein
VAALVVHLELQHAKNLLDDLVGGGGLFGEPDDDDPARYSSPEILRGCK